MDVQKVLKENNITPRKELDQFFLLDEKLLNEEVKLARLKSSDSVLEIGAGPGNLTEKIAKKVRVIAIEKDYSFKNILRNVENTNVVFGDALEILESLRNAVKTGKPPMFNKIVSNLPYSRTQDIIIELLQHRWDVAVLVVPSEMMGKLGNKKEKISIVLNDCCDVSVERKIPADAFYPRAVDSSIITLTQKNMLDAGFWEFMKGAFANRNKNAKKVFKDCPDSLKKKKILQLDIKELKQLYEANK